MTNHSPEIALVTGSNRGLGKSTVLNLAKKGVDVIVTYHSNAEEATKVVADIELIGAKAVALQQVSITERAQNFSVYCNYI